MVTILIPTFNRGPFVVRTLGYYAAVGCPFTIVVADSSNDDHFAQTQAAIERLAGRISVEHRRYPDDYSNYQCLQAVLADVRTPHVAVIGDDDLLVPDALAEGAAFLDGHPDYCGVVGEAITVRTKDDAVIGRIIETGPYETAARPEDRAEDRLLRHMERGDSIDYALMRLEDRRFSVEIAVVGELYRKFGSFGEMANVALTLAGGKIHKLNRLMLVRQVHGDSSAFEYRLDIFDRLCEPEWSRIVGHLRDNIERSLITRAGLTGEAAQRLAKVVVWIYVQRNSAKDLSRFRAAAWPEYSPPNRRSPRRRLLSALGRTGLSRILATRWRARSLPALSSPSSPLHKDFVAVRASFEIPAL